MNINMDMFPKTRQHGYHEPKNRYICSPYLRQSVAFLLFFFSLLFPGVLLADDISVEADLNIDTFPLDQAALLTVTLKGSSNGRLEEPHIEGLQFTYQGQNSQMQWINGKASSSVSFVLLVQATQPGEYTIEPITVHVDNRKYSSNPIKCSVLPIASTNAPPVGKKGGQPVPPPSSTRLRSGEVDKVGFMRIFPEKETLYSGERLPFTIKALFRQGIRVSIKSAPRLTGGNFILESLDDKPRQSDEVIDGVPYTMVTWKGTFSAIKQGTFPMEVEMDASLIVRAKRQRPSSRFGSSPFNDPFFDDFFSGFSQKDITLISPKKNIEVKDLPDAGKPADFNGAVGSFSLAVSAQPTAVRSGDPITLKMMIQGTGNFDRVQAPAFPENNSWKTYPPTSETHVPVDDNGNKTFEQAIIPTNPQVKAIPPLHFSYFDPQLKNYLTVSSDPIPITFEENGKLTTQQHQTTTTGTQQADGPEKTFSEPGLAPIHMEFGQAVGSPRPLYQNRWFQMMMALSLFLLLTSVLLLLHRQRLNGDPLRFEKKSLMKELENLSAQAKQAMVDKDSRQFLTLCRLILQKRFGFTWQVEPQAICAADLGQQLHRNSPLPVIFRKAEHAAYTGEKMSQQEMNQILTTIQQELEQL